MRHCGVVRFFRKKLIPVNISAKIHEDICRQRQPSYWSWQMAQLDIDFRLVGCISYYRWWFHYWQKLCSSPPVAHQFWEEKEAFFWFGITANACCNMRRIHIGHDVVLHEVYITDSDWHAIEGRMRQTSRPEEHISVRISHDVSVLKSANIGKGSIIGAKSLVVGAIPDRCFAAGVPTKTIKNISWSRWCFRFFRRCT